MTLSVLLTMGVLVILSLAQTVVQTVLVSMYVLVKDIKLIAHATVEIVIVTPIKYAVVIQETVIVILIEHVIVIVVIVYAILINIVHAIVVIARVILIKYAIATVVIVYVIPIGYVIVIVVIVIATPIVHVIPCVLQRTLVMGAHVKETVQLMQQLVVVVNIIKI